MNIRLLHWVFLQLYFFQVVSSLNAYHADTLFAQANQHYKSADYQKALDTYLRIFEDGMVSAELYFNVGNCYYKLKKPGLARYYYELALQHRPYDNSILHNLELVLEILPGDVGFGMPTEIEKLKYALAFSYYPKLLFFVSILFLAVGCYYFSKYLNLKTKKYLILLFGFTFVSLFIFLSAMWINSFRNSAYLILVGESAGVRSEPLESSQDLFVLGEGAKVVLLEEYADFLKIKLNDGKVGWAEKIHFNKL